MDWSDKAKQIQAIVTDIDGVLTNGGIGYGGDLQTEFKFFNVKDGTGSQIARKCGLKVCALSGRVSSTNRRRLNELKFDVILEDCHEKHVGLQQICCQLDIKPQNCLYIGDDLIDLTPFAIAGISAAPADAMQVVRDAADWTLAAKGGEGCLREVVEKLLKYQGKLDEFLKKYYVLCNELRKENQ